MIYSLPLSMLVDEVRAEQGGSWLGRSVLGGLELGRFRMVRLKRQNNTTEEKRGHMIQQEKLHRKLVEYVQNVHAMEQNVSLMLESIILNTKDEGLAEMFRQHKAETRGQERRLRERLRELEGLTLASAGKDIAAIFTAQAKGIGDLLRTDKPVQNARDAFVTEHLEIAAYEILERLAERAGDVETAAVARENRTEEESMARRISDNWDKFLDLALVGEVIRP